jgi:phosphatidylglycerol---prolipoprotein diacylglyceryl transferase
MLFPVMIHLGPLSLHPHMVFELLAYSIGFQIWRLAQKHRADAPKQEFRLWLLVAVVLGAALGARGLAWLETPFDPLTGQWVLPGKTIAGGLLGGWAAIEFTKSKLNLTQRTGDSYVLPLCIGIALGRIGCFLTGLDDHTFGTATTLPWAVDFGDGVWRHPTQLYEAFWLMALLPLGFFLRKLRANWPTGIAFQGFICAYCAFRFGVEWIKPTLKIYGGLSAIQTASLIGLSCALYQVRLLLKHTSGEIISAEQS